MTAQVATAQGATLKVGLVFTTTTLDQAGTFRVDPSQLCSGVAYYTATGDWTAYNTMITQVPWPTPDQIDILTPGNQLVEVPGIAIQHDVAHGGINVTLTHD